jgi:hypothetical protein
MYTQGASFLINQKGGDDKTHREDPVCVIKSKEPVSDFGLGLDERENRPLFLCPEVRIDRLVSSGPSAY